MSFTNFSGVFGVYEGSLSKAMLMVLQTKSAYRFS